MAVTDVEAAKVTTTSKAKASSETKSNSKAEADMFYYAQYGDPA